MKPMPTIERIRELFSYDQETGILRWRRDGHNGAVRAGKVAGQSTKNCAGYQSVTIDGRSCRIHVVIWAYHYGAWPSLDIDHINRNRSDNRIVNLREATRSQNLANSKAKSGMKGASFDRRRGKWRARITVAYKEIWLGSFDTETQANAAYAEAAQKYFGEFARAA